MNQEAYGRFTQALTAGLAADERAIGLVALGSMAQQDYHPDQWSDHDFFMVVQPDAQSAFKQDLSWLPSSGEIVLSFQETAHGMKVLYASGHLLEFAVFDLVELRQAAANRYRVLLDRGDVAAVMAGVAAKTAVSPMTPSSSDHSIMGQFLANVQVGYGRYRRGELLSGHVFIKDYATRHLLTLLARHLPTAADRQVLDHFDPFRRFEQVFPAAAAEIAALQLLPPPETAVGLLAVAQRELAGRMPDYPETAVTVLIDYLRR